MGRAVLEGDLCSFVILEVGEFVGVFVGDEEEVRSFALRSHDVSGTKRKVCRDNRVRYLGNGHRPGHWSNTPANGGQETNLHSINSLVELFYLLRLRGRVVPLFRDCGVGLRVHLGGFEGFGHLAVGCSSEAFVCIS